MGKVFVTGRGLLTPLGRGVAVNEAALRRGVSGITYRPEFAEMKMDSQVGGMPDQDPETPLIDRKTKRFWPPVGAMSVVAAQEAFAEAGIALEDIPRLNMALVGGQAVLFSQWLTLRGVLISGIGHLKTAVIGQILA